MQQVLTNFFRVCRNVRFGFSMGKSKKVIVLAPHSDDESIGCAGTIFQLQSMGYEVVIVLFTSSADELSNNEKGELRLQEFQKAIEMYENCREIHFLYPDGKLTEFCTEAKEQLTEIIEREEPGIIFTPYIMDCHSDHKCVSKMLAEVVPHNDILVAMYEVWVPILHPNYYIDISEFWDKKKSVLQCYPSQVNQYSILEKAKELNGLRAKLSMRRKVKYVEAFKGIEAHEYIDLVKILNTEAII